MVEDRTPTNPITTPQDVVFFLKYVGDTINDDIVIIERENSRGFGYFDVYSPPWKSRRRKTSIQPSIADDYLAAILKEKDEACILNFYLSHLGDRVETLVRNGNWIRKPRSVITINRRYGWKDTDDARVLHHYKIIVKGVDNELMQYAYQHRGYVANDVCYGDKDEDKKQHGLTLIENGGVTAQP